MISFKSSLNFKILKGSFLSLLLQEHRHPILFGLVLGIGVTRFKCIHNFISDNFSPEELVRLPLVVSLIFSKYLRYTVCNTFDTVYAYTSFVKELKDFLSSSIFLCRFTSLHLLKGGELTFSYWSLPKLSILGFEFSARRFCP
ncbi:hypothetical protein RCL_jg322.t2 [Rhizophagus clarus]|uniref:Uncharacterized protein n=1 Tax=Rhizophagus clarus TaxID=94130 RepID=A0A8H3M1M3_9GLOM|nr:hypothetical protein RCL_jg322.t2 [Rhizophagus clarus]